MDEVQRRNLRQDNAGPEPRLPMPGSTPETTYGRTASPGRDVEVTSRRTTSQAEEGKPDQDDRSLTHAIGMGAGGGVGAIAGGIIGAAAGPGGVIIGAGLGALAGAMAGRGVSEAISPAEEEEHWRRTYHTREYVAPGKPFDEYRPAYRFGWEHAAAHVPEGRTFEAVEPELERRWSTTHGVHQSGAMSWMHARPAARDAWERVESRIKRREHDAGRMY